MFGKANRSDGTTPCPLPARGLEDDIEPVLELSRVIVARLHGLIGDVFDEVGELVRGEWLKHPIRHRWNLLGRVEREVHLRQREAIDAAVQERVGIGRHLDVRVESEDAAGRSTRAACSAGVQGSRPDTRCHAIVSCV